MSHNYQNRRQPPDSDLRSNPRHYSSEADSSFYRWPQESFSSSSSSSRTSAALQLGQSSQDGVLSLLNSCGLEPEDLAVLAKLPEEALTIESLPQVIRQIKGKKGSINPSPHSPHPSYSFSSSHQLPVSSTSRDWDQDHRQPVQYPLQCVTPTVPHSQMFLGSLGAHRTSSSVRSPSSSSLPSRPTLDSDHRPRPPDYGKAVSSYSSGESKKGARPSRSSDAETSGYRTVPPPEERSRSFRSSNSSRSVATMPSKNQALDFHGSSPPLFPYSCSLCDITVLSEKAWIQHINSTDHANGQLKLLQQFSDWDCRVKTVNRGSSQSERRKDEPSPAPSAQRASQSQASQTDKKQHKASDKGRVVCVKFPAQSVDETYLRKLIDPFGKIVKMLLFPSVAFVELGSADQAKDLVKFHSGPAANKEQIEFSVSSTFSFLQSSLVVSFTPAPTGEDGRSDLISIVKRFGEPLYTLFLPSKAFVEMKFSSDAQKLVDYYSSNPLRVNGVSISVSFSSEYKSLMRVSLAKKYEEEPTTTRSKEPSQDPKTSSRSRGEDRSRTRSRSKSRDKSRAQSSQEKKSGSTDGSSRGEQTRSKSKDRSSKEERTKTTSRETSIDKSSRDTESRSKEGSSSSSVRQNQSEVNSEEPEKPDTDRRPAGGPGDVSTDRRPAGGPGDVSTDRRPAGGPGDVSTDRRPAGGPGDVSTDRRPDGGPEDVSTDRRPDGAEDQQMDDEMDLSADESDIEGMEVIAEDGQNVEDEDVETLEEEEEEEKHCPEGKVHSPEEAEEEVKNMERDDQEEENKESDDKNLVMKEEKRGEEEEKTSGMKKQEEDVKKIMKPEEKEAGFPSDLENCVTLDEVDFDDEDGADHDDGSESSSASSRVLFFSSMPLSYTDTELIKLMTGFGTVVRYLLIHNRQQGFVEMATPSEAQKAATELQSKPVYINGSRLIGSLSQEHLRLTTGWSVPSNQEEEEKSECSRQVSRRSGRLNRSRTSDPHETSDTSEETKGLLGKTQKKKSDVPETETDEKCQEKGTPQKTSDRKTRSKKTPETESETSERSERTPKETTEKISDRKTRSKKTPEETTEKEVSDKIPEVDLMTETSEEKELQTTSEEEKVGETPTRASSSRRGAKSGTEKRKGTPEDNEVPLKTQRTEPEEGGTSQEKDPEEPELPEDKEAASDAEERRDGRETSTQVCVEKKPEVKSPEGLDRSEAAEQDAETEQQSEPEPARPVGAEFVRPVVGYFCNLCQLIFSDEDEAKLQHCSTPEHYRKYQEKTGKDPRTS